MNLNTDKKLANILMSVGLGILSLGIAYWIHSEHGRQKELLKERMDLTLSNTLSDLNQDLSSKVLTFFVKRLTTGKETNLSISSDKKKGFLAFNDPEEASLEIIKIDFDKSAIAEAMADKNETETSVYIDEGNGITEEGFFETGFSNISQALSIEEIIKKDSSITEKDFIDFTEKSLQGLLEKNISQDLISLKLSVKINDFNKGVDSTILKSWVFKENITKKNVFITSVNHEYFIFQKILPQCLISLLTLLIISLAFYFIYSAMKKQNQLTQLRSDFMNNMTHELKTPITTIGVALEAIEDFGVDNNPELRKEYIDISRGEVNRLSLLVDKVLNISKYESTEIQLHKNELDLSKLINNIFFTLKIQFQKYNATYKINLKGNDFKLIGDKSHITNVIYNLVDNGLKYGGNPPRLIFNLIENHNSISLEIKDNGNGIPLKFQKQIFDKFFRIPTDDIHNVSGHGLGLSYVKKIVEMHQGKINVKSEEEKGTTFTIEIPKKSEA